MITDMNSRMTKTMPRKARLATASGEMATPPSVATFGRLDAGSAVGWNGSELSESFGQCRRPVDDAEPSAAKPTSWVRTPSAGPFVA